MKSPARLTDHLQPVLTAGRDRLDVARLTGRGTWELTGPDGEVKARGVFHNLITDYGDQYYAERALASPAAIVTGMRLGTGGATAAAKNGAGAAIVTYVSGSSQPLDGNPTAASLGAGAGHRVRYVVTWTAGEATASGINEAVVTNETSLTNVAGVAGNTISRGVLSPAVNKGAADQLVITWDHAALGA